MYTFLVILFILLSFAMVIVILLQAGKGQGLAGAIGGGMGGSSMFGGRGAADFLSKATTWLAALYMIFAILMGYMYKTTSENQTRSLMEQNLEQQGVAEPSSSLPLAPIGGDEQPAEEEENQNQE